MVESVDPIILSMKLVDVCECRPGIAAARSPPSAPASRGAGAGGDVHRLYVTLGQFSIIRMERDTQLLIPAYDYCLPDKECTCGGCECGQEDPCEIFRKVQFPVNEFFPPNSLTPKTATSYQEGAAAAAAPESGPGKQGTPGQIKRHGRTVKPGTSAQQTSGVLVSRGSGNVVDAGALGDLCISGEGSPSTRSCPPT